jgi:hypothetical protein
MLSPVRLARFVRRGGICVLVATLASSLAPPATAGPERGRSGPDRAYRTRTSPATLRAARQDLRRSGVSPTRAAGRGTLEPVPAGKTFPAITGDKGISPADPIGAAGIGHVVTAVNVHYAVYDKDSGDEVIGPNPLRTLFRRAPFPFDPKVVYDHYRGRFILVFLTGRFGGPRPRSWINVVSMRESTIDQPGTWCKRKLKGDPVRRHGNLFADYPGLGFDRKRIYITTNQFTFGTESFRYAQILALRKRGMYDCDARVRRTVFSRGQTRDPQGTRAFTIQPAVTETETGASPPEFLASFQDTGCAFTCGRRLTIWRIKETRRGLRLAKRSVPVGLARVAPWGTQKGGSPSCGNPETCWDTGDLRLINAFYDADRRRLYTAHAVEAQFAEPGPPDAQVESAIRWYEVDATPLRSARATRRAVFGAPNTFAGWPAAGTDAAGNLFITYSRATAFAPDAEFLSVWVATIAPGTEDAEAALIEAGNDTYVDPDNPGPQRWGDYNGISRDPVDPSVIWSVNQVAQDDAEPPARTDQWQQWVHPLRAAP